MTWTCWIIGDAERAEFRPLLADLSQREIALWQAPDVRGVEARIKSGAMPPDLLVVLESWPDEFPATRVTRLLSAAPLARVICIAGAWCEASGRTRSHWPLALRVPLWIAEQRIGYEFDVLSGRESSLPWTATREEWILAGSGARDQTRGSGSARVEIYDRALREMLSAELGRIGCEVVCDTTRPVNSLFVQAEPASAELLAQIAELCRAVAPEHVIAVTTWPLPEWVEQLRAAGVATVINPLGSPLTAIPGLRTVI